MTYLSMLLLGMGGKEPMTSEDYWMDQVSRLRSEKARLETQIDQAKGILYGGLDRDRDEDDSLRTLCVVAVNALAMERA